MSGFQPASRYFVHPSEVNAFQQKQLASVCYSTVFVELFETIL